MSKQVTLKAERRDTKGKGVARKLRANGRIPAVLYGFEMEPIPLSVDAHDTHLLFSTISVENTLVDVTIGSETFPTLVREVQAHPFRPMILHVDFLRIQKGVKVELTVPVHLVGTPVGVKDAGGVMDHVVHEVSIRCIPSLIPESFDLDVTRLQVGDSLHVSDITFPEGVELMTDMERTICHVAAPRLAEVAEVDESVEVVLISEEKEGESGASEGTE